MILHMDILMFMYCILEYNVASRSVPAFEKPYLACFELELHVHVLNLKHSQF